MTETAPPFVLSISGDRRRQRAVGAWLQRIHDGLLAYYGRQGWWPGETPFEVMIGAVLTQNTQWRNVERAISALRQAGLLVPSTLLNAPQQTVAELIRPSGYFNVKARRLQALVRFVDAEGGVEALAGWETAALRQALLAVHGIGPETADDILLYAFSRPVFVIDAYTRRLMGRLTASAPGRDYEAWRAFFERHLPADSGLYNEFHALVVRHSQQHCSARPHCAGCPLLLRCQTGRFARPGYCQ